MHIAKNQFGNFLISEWDLVPASIATGKFWDEHIKSYIDKYVNKNMIVLDIGAHCGFHTVYMSTKAGGVFSFEPQRMIYFQLCSNLFLNNITNVIPHNKACYNKECKLSIAPPQSQVCPMPLDQNGNVDYSKTSNTAGLALSQVPGEIEATTVDIVLRDLPHKLGFIKCDAQGSDLKAMQGAINSIQKHKPVIVFEFEPLLSPIHGNTWADYEKFFQDIKYGLERIQAAHVNPTGTTEYVARPN